MFMENFTVESYLNFMETMLHYQMKRRYKVKINGVELRVLVVAKKRKMCSASTINCYLITLYIVYIQHMHAFAHQIIPRLVSVDPFYIVQCRKC